MCRGGQSLLLDCSKSLSDSQDWSGQQRHPGALQALGLLAPPLLTASHPRSRPAVPGLPATGGPRAPRPAQVQENGQELSFTELPETGHQHGADTLISGRLKLFI